MGRQKAFLSGPHTTDLLVLVKARPHIFKGGPSRLVPYGAVQTFDLFTSFHKQGKFLKGNLERALQKDRSMPSSPNCTSTHRLHSPMTFESCDLTVGHGCHAK